MLDSLIIGGEARRTYRRNLPDARGAFLRSV